MNTQECKVRREIINVNSNEPVFDPFSIKANKSNGSCNNIKDRYASMCVPDVAKNLNVKVFNLMYKCKDASVCNNKQHWNDDKCWCEGKELTDKAVCDRGYIWNPSNYECECDNSCYVGEY